MLALLICILASTVISLIFEGFQRFGVRNLPAIVVNYFVCVICGSLFQGEWVLDERILSAPWLGLAFVLGFFFIGGFNLNAACVQRAGVAVTSVVQRTSLLISVGFAVAYYHEQLDLSQVIGIALGLLAVVLAVRFEDSPAPSKTELQAESGAYTKSLPLWVLPLAVFLVAGAIESLLMVAQRSYGAEADVSFSISLFLWAGILGLIINLVRRPASGVARFTGRDLVGGIVLGIPNFFSIHLILVALGDGLSAAVVFPVLSVATIVLSTLAAMLLFSERLSPKQWAGVGVAVVSIALITGLLFG